MYSAEVSCEQDIIDLSMDLQIILKKSNLLITPLLGCEIVSRFVGFEGYRQAQNVLKNNVTPSEATMAFKKVLNKRSSLTSLTPLITVGTSKHLTYSKSCLEPFGIKHAKFADLLVDTEDAIIGIQFNESKGEFKCESGQIGGNGIFKNFFGIHGPLQKVYQLHPTVKKYEGKQTLFIDVKDIVNDYKKEIGE